MRITKLPLALVLLSTGCVDATGIFSDCSSDMAAIRAQYGAPDNPRDLDATRGDYRETYEYFDEGVRFIFEWGDSFSGCQVTEGELNNLVPERESPLTPLQD